jgi:hypothetical protein
MQDRVESHPGEFEKIIPAPQLGQMVTRLSERDRRLVAEMFQNETTKPNEALGQAARQYRKQVLDDSLND